MAVDNDRFDFRIAVRERERAVRLLEAIVSRSAHSGEHVDRELLTELRAFAAGRSTNQIRRGA